MKTQSSLAAAAFCALAVPSLLTPNGLLAAEKPDYKAIAERMVGQSAKVKEGDRVVVRGDVRDLDLIEQLTLAVWKRGAEPLQIVGREQAARGYIDEVPAQYDASPLHLSQKLIEAETVEITVSGLESPGLLSNVAPERLAANEKSTQSLMNARLKRGGRMVEIGNGLYPTEATAQRYGVTKDQLAQLFWDGINMDYSKVQATGAAVWALLAAGKEVHVTHPNGTDVHLRIERRPVFGSDGVISADAVAKGGPAAQVWLPAGEVYLVPVPGTAEGKIVFDTLPFEAGGVVDATFTIKSGKLTAHSAKPGPEYDRWQALYAAAPAGKADFAILDLGINPKCQDSPGQ
jgi:leucyl aminopeptidase (aminopeptidase T)